MKKNNNDADATASTAKPLAPLDVWDCLATNSLYLPDFTKKDFERELEWTRRRVWGYLGTTDNDLKELLLNHGNFMHVLRILGNYEDGVFPDFDSKFVILEKLWKLFTTPNLPLMRRVRLCDLLNYIVKRTAFLHACPVWLQAGSRSSYVEDERIKKLGRVLQWRTLFSFFEKRFSRTHTDPIETSCAKRKHEIASYVRLVESCRRFWDSLEVGSELIKEFEMDGTPDLRNASIFYKIRILLLFCGPKFWFVSVTKGNFFKWWSYLGCRAASTYDSTFIHCLFHAVKWGWSSGQPCNDILRPYLPILFQILTNSLGAPVAGSLPLQLLKDSVPGELTVLLAKNLNVLRKLAKIIALLLEPLDGPTDLKKPPSRRRKSSITEVVFDPQSVWTFVTTLKRRIYPLTHPSNVGRWCSPISEFVSAFTMAYTRRVGRERLATNVVGTQVGRSGSLSYRLGQQEDEYLCSLFLPVVLQGVYSRNPQIGTCFEGALKRLCYLSPSTTLPTVLQGIEGALESVTETHQLQSALRMLSQLTPLILQRTPQALSTLLSLTIPAIDGTEPFKSVQCLTFYAVLLCNCKCADLSDVDLTDDEVDKAAQKIKRLLFFSSDEKSRDEPSPFISFENYPPETLVMLKRRGSGASSISTSAAAVAASEDPLLDAGPAGAEAFTPALLKERAQTFLSATPLLPDWGRRLFRELLKMISCASAAPDKSSRNKNAPSAMENLDTGFAAMIRFTVHALASDSTEEDVRGLCTDFLEWLQSNICRDASKFMGIVARSLAFASPTIAVEILLPPLISKFFESKGREFTIDDGNRSLSHSCSEDSSFPSVELLGQRRLSVASQETEPREEGSNKRAMGSGVRNRRASLGSVDEELLDTFLSPLKQTSLAIYPDRLGVLEPSKEMELCWYLSCFGALLRAGSSEHFRKYEREVQSVVLWAIRHPNERVADLGIKAARRIVESCCCTFLRDSRKSSPPSTQAALFNGLSPFFQNLDAPQLLAFRAESGQLPSCAPLAPILDVSWKLPTPQDLQFATKIIALALDHALQLLRKACEGADEEVASLFSAKELAPGFLNGFLGSGVVEDSQTADSAPLSGSTAQNLNKALQISAALLRAVTPLFPDERGRVAPGFPVIAAPDLVDGKGSAHHLGLELSEFVSKVVIRLARVFLGLEVVEEVPGKGFAITSDQNVAHRLNNVRYTEPLIQLQGTEDSSLIQKILSSLSQCLLRQYSVGGLHAQSGTQGHLWASLTPWLSGFHGILPRSLYQDVSTLAWDERHAANWMLRIDKRRDGHSAIRGQRRRTLLLLNTRLTNHFYAACRAKAQDLLASALNCHYGARTVLIRMLLNDMEMEAESLIASNQQQAFEPRSPKVGSPAGKRSSPIRAQKAVDEEPCTVSSGASSPGSRMGENTKSAEEEMRLARLTGATYVLLNTAMQRRIWSDSQLLAKTLTAVVKCFLAPIERDKIQVRLLKLLKTIFNFREAVKFDQNFERLIVEGVLKDLLLRMLSNSDDRANDQGSGAHSWRFQLAATAMLAVFAGGRERLDASVEEAYGLWLITACDPKKLPPLINTLSSFALMQYLQRSCERGVKEVSPTFISKLKNEESIRAIAQCLVHAHHESCRSVTTTSFPETALQVVVEILRFDRSWPFSRLIRVSRSLSIHNILTVQSILQFHCKTPDPSVATSIVDLWLTIAAEFLAQPAGEIEYQVAACEIISAVLRAGAEDFSIVERAWRSMFNLMQECYRRLDQNTFSDFLDALHYAADLQLPTPSPITDRERLIPLVGAVLAPVCSSAEDCLEKTKAVMDGEGSIELSSTSSSLELGKQIRVVALAFLQARWSGVPLIAASKATLLNTLSFPYKQIRMEVGKCFYDICNNAADPFTPSDYTDATFSLLEDLEHRLPALEQFVNETSIEARNLETQRADQLCEAETLFYFIKLIFSGSITNFFSSFILETFPVLFSTIKHPDQDAANFAYTALLHGAVASSGIPPPAEPGKTGHVLQSHQSFISAVLQRLAEQQHSTSSWRARHTVVKYVELMGLRIGLSIQGTAEFKALIDVCVSALLDPQSEVRAQARNTLSLLSVFLSDNECNDYIKQFLEWAGPPLSISDRPSSKTLAGVAGIIALVHSAPFHVPKWLPAAVTMLARYGHSKSPDSVKRQVQDAIQEFFRTHQDAWKQCHSKEFNEEQLDILETYKGRPVYIG